MKRPDTHTFHRETVPAFCLLVFAAVVSALILHGCISDDLYPGNPPGFEKENPGNQTSFHLLEGFEDVQEWAVDSAENHADLSTEANLATEGANALRVKYWTKGRYKAQVRKETGYDFRRVTHLKIDIHNPSDDPDVSFGFAFRTKHGDRFFETVPIKLNKGWNYGVVLPLNEKAFKPLYEKNTYRFWHEGRGCVTRIMVQFFEGNIPNNEVIIDNLRCNVPKEKVFPGFRPGILSVKQDLEWLNQYEKVEITVRGKVWYTDAFNPDDVSVRMNVRTPGGDHKWINGFLYDFEEVNGRKLPIWKIRYTPTDTGVYNYEVFLRSRKGEAVMRGMRFEVFPSSSRGFVTVSKKHPLFFEFSGGEFFYPFGQNISWASDYGYYFRKVNEYGGNFVRIWLCPWNLYLEPTKSLGKYDLEVGRELDEIIELAAEYGIYIQLVFEYHDMLKQTWDKSPYNIENGGICPIAEDFFRHGEAKKFFKRKMDYIVNRWGYSPNIMAWELFNEVDISKYSHENDVYAWHKEMSAHLKITDPNNHLVTTSMCVVDKMQKMWEFPHIDYSQSHFYNPDAFQKTDGNYAAMSRFGKPNFIGEFGRGWRADDDNIDKEGRHLHHTIWSQFMTPSAGGAMPWWWDTYIEPYNLYPIFGGLAEYAKGLDRRAQELKPIRMTVTLGEDSIVRIVGLQNSDSVYLWFYNPELVLHPRMSREDNLLTRDVTVYFKNMMDGVYVVEYWDAYKGTVFNRFELTARNSEFSIKLHKADWDYAVKIKRRDIGLPEAGFIIKEEPNTQPDTSVDDYPYDNFD